MQNRDIKADIFKGIGIILMLIGHVGLWGPLSYWLHAFHMPMFFFISGYLYKEKVETCRKRILGKCRNLLAPYVITGIVLFLCECARSVLWNYEMPYKQGLNLLWDNTSNVPIGGIWFLTALLWTNVIFILLKQTNCKDIILGVICLIIGLVGLLAACYLPFRLPWALDAGMVGTLFYYVGYIIRKRKSEKNVLFKFNIPVVFLLLISLVNIALIFINGEVNMRTGEYSNWILFIFNAIVAILSLLNVSGRLEHISKNNRIPKIVNSTIAVLKNIGEHSLLYVCFNQLIITLCSDILANFLIWDNWSAIVRFLIKGIVICITVLFTEMLSKTSILDILFMRWGKKDEVRK